MTRRLAHVDGRICEHQDDGNWTVRENPLNRGVVGLTCERHGRIELGLRAVGE